MFVNAMPSWSRDRRPRPVEILALLREHPLTGHRQSVAETVREHVSVTTCGYTTNPPLLCALTVFGSGRILFSVDYPFSDNAVATTYLRNAPVSPADLDKIAHENADRTPVSLERIGLELEAALDRDTCYVCDVDSGKTMDPLMSFGGDDKQYFATSPNILGWGMAAAFGVKLARPDQRSAEARARAMGQLKGRLKALEGQLGSYLGEEGGEKADGQKMQRAA